MTKPEVETCACHASTGIVLAFWSIKVKHKDAQEFALQFVIKHQFRAAKMLTCPKVVPNVGILCGSMGIPPPHSQLRDHALVLCSTTFCLRGCHHSQTSAREIRHSQVTGLMTTTTLGCKGCDSASLATGWSHAPLLAHVEVPSCSGFSAWRAQPSNHRRDALHASICRFVSTFCSARLLADFAVGVRESLALFCGTHTTRDVNVQEGRHTL